MPVTWGRRSCRHRREGEVAAEAAGEEETTTIATEERFCTAILAALGIVFLAVKFYQRQNKTMEVDLL